MKTNPSRILPLILVLAVFSSGWMLRASVAVEAMVEADHKLNVGYKKQMAAIPGAAQREKLKAAQRAWMLAEVAFRSVLDDTSKAGFYVRIELLEARAAQLEGVLQSR